MTDNHWRFSNKNQKTTVEVTGSYLLNHSEMRRDAIEQGFVLTIYPITPRNKELKQESSFRY